MTVRKTSTKERPLIKTVFARIRSSFDRFVRAHIIDDERNIWPDLPVEFLD